MAQKNICKNLMEDFEWIDLFDSYVEERERHMQYMNCRNKNAISKSKASKDMYKESDEIRK